MSIKEGVARGRHLLRSHKCEKITLALKCVRECEEICEILTAGQSAWLDRSLDGGERK